MATVGGVEPFACVSLTCVHQKGLFARVASEIIVASPFPRYLLLTGANFFFFFFSYFSSLSYDITLAPHSGNFIGTQEGDQETGPPQPNQGGCVFADLVMATHPFINQCYTERKALAVS